MCGGNLVGKRGNLVGKVRTQGVHANHGDKVEQLMKA